MSDYTFRQQRLTRSILGLPANPLADTNAPTIIGSIEAAHANGFTS